MKIEEDDGNANSYIIWRNPPGGSALGSKCNHACLASFQVDPFL